MSRPQFELKQIFIATTLVALFLGAFRLLLLEPPFAIPAAIMVFCAAADSLRGHPWRGTLIGVGACLAAAATMVISTPEALALEVFMLLVQIGLAWWCRNQKPFVFCFLPFIFWFGSAVLLALMGGLTGAKFPAEPELAGTGGIFLGASLVFGAITGLPLGVIAMLVCRHVFSRPDQRDR